MPTPDNKVVDIPQVEHNSLYLLGQISGQMQMLLARFDTFEKHHVDEMALMKSRLSTLEQTSAHRGGSISTITATVTIIASLFATFLSSIIGYFVGKH